ncbi:hypothetical protein AAEU41_06605 [Pantoea agglomerans]|nr:hypothetical protein [Enterobacter sp. DRP3]
MTTSLSQERQYAGRQGEPSVEKNTFYSTRCIDFIGLQKTNWKMRGFFSIETIKTKKAPAGAFFRTQFNPMAKLSYRKYWRGRAVLYPA